jgi:hypothetical protein
MKGRSDNGCAHLLIGIVLFVIYQVVLQVVEIFDPNLFANTRFCCTATALLLILMALTGDEAQQEVDATLRHAFILLLVAVGAWVLAPPAKTLLAHVQTWMVAHPQVGLTLIGVVCLGPPILLGLLPFLAGPATSTPYASRQRYSPEDSDGYYDS